MPSYDYEAAHQVSGRIERGVIEADSERHARQQLRARELLPLAVQAQAQRTAGARATRRRMNRYELGWVNRQLAALLGAGLTLESALTAVMEQADRKAVAELLLAVRSDVRAGHRLCDAMAAHPREFPATHRALIEAGEQSGELAQVMQRLADYSESQDALRSKMLTALLYPAIVTLVAVGIIIFLLTHVVPQVVGAFAQTRQELPWLTRLLLAVSDFATQHGGWLVLALAGAALLGRWALRYPATRLVWHSRLLRLPLVGRFIQGVNTERFAATLAILSASGVPLLKALEASGRTLANIRLQQAVDEATRQVREGSTLAAALRRQKVFPPMLIHLIESGEHTGKLPLMLEGAARTLAADLELRAARLAAILEPLLTLLMGGLVLFVVLAIMLPIIEINQMVL